MFVVQFQSLLEFSLERKIALFDKIETLLHHKRKECHGKEYILYQRIRYSECLSHNFDKEDVWYPRNDKKQFRCRHLYFDPIPNREK